MADGVSRCLLNARFSPSVFLHPQMSDGQSRASEGSGGGEEQPGRSAGGRLLVPRRPPPAPPGRHSDQEVHARPGCAGAAVARAAAGGRRSAGAAGEAHAVLGSPLRRGLQPGGGAGGGTAQAAEGARHAAAPLTAQLQTSVQTLQLCDAQVYFFI